MSSPFRDLLETVLHIEAAIDRIYVKLGATMATAQDFKNLVDALNAETDRLAAKLQDLLNKLSAGGMTAEEEAAALAAGQAVVDRLKSLGQDPSNPIPPTP